MSHQSGDPASLKTVFRIRGLTKVYPMGEVSVQALRGMDLDLYEDELAVLLGPSGSGKSTLLNIIGGLEEGDRIIIYPGDRVGEGIRVRPR